MLVIREECKGEEDISLLKMAIGGEKGRPLGAQKVNGEWANSECRKKTYPSIQIQNVPFEVKCRIHFSLRTKKMEMVVWTGLKLGSFNQVANCRSFLQCNVKKRYLDNMSSDSEVDCCSFQAWRRVRHYSRPFSFFIPRKRRNLQIYAR